MKTKQTKHPHYNKYVSLLQAWNEVLNPEEKEFFEFSFKEDYPLEPRAYFDNEDGELEYIKPTQLEETCYKASRGDMNLAFEFMDTALELQQMTGTDYDGDSVLDLFEKNGTPKRRTNDVKVLAL